MRPAALKIVLLSLFVPVSGYAGGLIGTVSDPQGLAVAGATVRVACGGRERATKTNSEGGFSFAARPAGPCAVAIKHPGFAPFQETLGNGVETLAARLSLAPISQVVTVVAENEDPGPLLRPALTSVSLDADELNAISNNTTDFIRYAKIMAGVTGGTDAVYVDGLPGGVLPPAEMVARITVNGDPFSAEYADGDQSHIDITTKTPDRKFRFGFGGPSLSAGGHSPLDPGLKSDSSSRSGYVSGPLPNLPLTFSLRGTLGSSLNEQPILAVLPPGPQFALYNGLRGAAVNNHTGSGALNLDYGGAERFRARLGYSESHASGSNLGVGGLNLPETGFRLSSTTGETRIGITESANQFVFHDGLLVTQTRSDTNANSDAIGVTVLGDFVSGGAPLASNETYRTAWTWKNVFESPSAWPSWIAGVTVSGSDELHREVPNAQGAFEFANLQAYTDAMDGQGTGTWLVMRGIGTVRYKEATAAPFVQKRLTHSTRILVTGGLRGDYQPSYGMMMSPRLSVAARLGSFVVRAGGGLFVRNLPSSVFVKVLENDGSHLQQYMVTGASFTGQFAPGVASGEEIHSQLAPGLTRPREIMEKSSIERLWGKFATGAEYTWTLDRHLLGSQRFADGNGWLDLLESNRSAERHRIHTQLRYKWKTQIVAAHYEWIRSRDDTSGPFSFPEQQNDLRAEWARSAGISPHNISLAGSFKLPSAVSLTATETWRSSAPYNITTGLDPAGDGLYTDRGGRPRNSGDGPGYNALTIYGHRRIALPAFPGGHNRRTYLDVGVQGDNLLGNKNFLSLGSIVDSPTFGRPLAASPGRSFRVWFNLN